MSPTTSHLTRRGIVALIAALPLAALGVAPAQARPDWTGQTVHVQKMYDNAFAGEPDYILLGGPTTLSGWCAGEPAPVVMRVTTTPSRESYDARGWLDMQLYDAAGLSAPDFVGQACSTGVFPEPIGTGTGWLQDVIQVDLATDTARNPNSLTGTITTADGRSVHVRGKAVNQFDSPEVVYPVTVTLTVSGNLP